METTAQLTPKDLLAYYEAFTKSLDAMNHTAHLQRMQVVDLAVHAMAEMIRLCNAGSGQSVEAQMKAISDQVSAAISKMGSGEQAGADAVVPPVGNDNSNAYQSLVAALSMAAYNAVSNQQQMNTIGQAATTQAVATLLSMVTSVVAKKESSS